MSGRLVQSTSGLAGPASPMHFAKWPIRFLTCVLLRRLPRKLLFGTFAWSRLWCEASGAASLGVHRRPCARSLENTSARHRFNRAHSEHSPCKPDIAFKHAQTCTDQDMAIKATGSCEAQDAGESRRSRLTTRLLVINLKALSISREFFLQLLLLVDSMCTPDVHRKRAPIHVRASYDMCMIPSSGLGSLQGCTSCEETARGSCRNAPSSDGGLRWPFDEICISRPVGSRTTRSKAGLRLLSSRTALVKIIKASKRVSTHDIRRHSKAAVALKPPLPPAAMATMAASRWLPSRGWDWLSSSCQALRRPGQCSSVKPVMRCVRLYQDIQCEVRSCLPEDSTQDPPICYKRFSRTHATADQILHQA